MKKNQAILLAALLFLSTAMSSCELIGDLIEFGIWVGIIIVVAVAALIYWIIRKIRK